MISAAIGALLLTTGSQAELELPRVDAPDSSKSEMRLNEAKRDLVCPRGESPAVDDPVMSEDDYNSLVREALNAKQANEIKLALSLAERFIPESRARNATTAQRVSHAGNVAAYADLLLRSGRANEAIQASCEAAFLFGLELGANEQSTWAARWLHAMSLSAAGDWAKAEPLLREQLTRIEKNVPAGHPQLLDLQSRLAQVRAKRGFPQDALTTLKRIREDLPADADYQLLLIPLNAEALILGDHASPAESIAFFDGLNEQYWQDNPRDRSVRRWVLGAKSAWLTMRNQPEEAIKVIDELIALDSTWLGPIHPATLLSKQSKVNALKQAGRYDDALKLARALLEDWENSAAPRDASYNARSSLANLNLKLREYDRAIALLKENVALRSAIYGARSTGTLDAKVELAQAYSAAGRHSDAATLSEEIVSVYELVGGLRSRDGIYARANLASNLVDLEQLERAELIAASAFEDALALLDKQDPIIGLPAATLSMVHSKRGDRDKILATSQKLYDLWKDDPDQSHPTRVGALIAHSGALYFAGEKDAGRDLLQELEAMARREFSAENNILIQILQEKAQRLWLTGDLVAAEPVAAEAFQLARDNLGPASSVTRSALQTYALTSTAAGQSEQALLLFDEFMGQLVNDKGVSDREYFETLIFLGFLELSQGYYDAALDTFSTVESVTSKSGDLVERSVRNAALLGLTTSAALSGKLEVAEKHNLELQTLSQELVDAKANHISSLAFPKMVEAVINLDREEFGLIDRNLSALLESEGAFPTGDASLNMTLLGMLSYVRSKINGREIAGFQAAQDLASLHREHRSSLGFNPRNEQDDPFASKLISDFNRVIADAAYSARDKLDEKSQALELAFEGLQNATLDKASLAIAKSASLRAAEQANVGSLARERLGLLDRWANVNQDLGQNLSTLSAVPSDQTSGRLARMERAAIESRLEEIDETLMSDFPSYYGFIRPQPLDVDQASALFASDEAALMLVPSEAGTHAMVITSEGLRWHLLDWSAEVIAEKVSEFRKGLEVSGSLPVFDFDLAHELYLNLIAPVENTLGGKSRVYIVTDGSLSRIPLSVLLTQPLDVAEVGEDRLDANADPLRATTFGETQNAMYRANDPADFRRASWLADRYALVTLPSLQSLVYIRTFGTDAEASEGSDYMGFGDPILAEYSTNDDNRSAGLASIDAATMLARGGPQDGLMKPASLRRMQSLPGTKRELEQVSQLIGNSQPHLFLGAAMTEPAIRTTDLSKTRILHLATHGLTSEEGGRLGDLAEPGLVFTPPDESSPENDGYLAASEVLGLNLARAEWVILSACNTAAPSGKEGDTGLSGLAQAFFYAGAESLLVSHWPVFDSVAPVLTAETLRRAEAGIPKAEAFQQAMQEVRKTNPHPAAWAPFVLVGEGR